MKEWQARMRDFTKQTGLQRQPEREWSGKGGGKKEYVLPGGGEAGTAGGSAIGLPGVPPQPSGLSIQEAGEIGDPGIVDPDLVRAQAGKLFDLTSTETEIVSSNLIDLTERYGNDQLRADKVVFESKEKGHVWWAHPNDREWFSNNQELFLRAINDPLFVDIVPRQHKAGINIAHVIEIGDEDPRYLNVVINFRRGVANIWTAFRADSRYLFSINGELEKRWLKVK